MSDEQAGRDAADSPEVNVIIEEWRAFRGPATRPTNRWPTKGETMTTAAMVTYALDQIDQARAELKTVSK